MASTWQTDLGAAEEWVRSLVSQTAGARAWSSEWLSLADQAVDGATPGWWDAIMTDPVEFYGALAAWWESAGSEGLRAGLVVPNGWDQLGNTWASAGNAAYTAQEEEDLGSASTLVSGTVTGSVQDIQDIGQSGLDFFSPTHTWINPRGYKFWGAALGIGGVVWLGYKATR